MAEEFEVGMIGYFYLPKRLTATCQKSKQCLKQEPAFVPQFKISLERCWRRILFRYGTSATVACCATYCSFPLYVHGTISSVSCFLCDKNVLTVSGLSILAGLSDYQEIYLKPRLI